MYGCESWTIKKAECQRTDAFNLWSWRRLLRAPWTARRSNLSRKGNQSWIFTGRTDVESETPILWPPDAKNWLIRKDPDAGTDRRWEEKGMTEDEMVGWHHWLSGHEFEYTLGVGDGQGSLVCCGLWGRKESDTTEWLNWTELNALYLNLKNEVACFCLGLPLKETVISEVFSGALGLLPLVIPDPGRFNCPFITSGLTDTFVFTWCVRKKKKIPQLQTPQLRRNSLLRKDVLNITSHHWWNLII